MSTYGAVFRHALFPVWEQHLRGRPTLEHLAWLERTQWSSTDELRAIQSAALRRLVHHAYAHVPFYRAQLDGAGLLPDDIRALEDLARLPVLTRDAATGAGDARKSTVAPRCELTKTTGGSTGAPLRFGYDCGSEYWRQATKLRGWHWAGYGVGDRTFYYWGEPTSRVAPVTRLKVAADRLLRRERYVDCTRRGDADLAAALDDIRRFRPERLICYTQAGIDLARYALEHGVRSWDTLPVLCCAEKLTAAGRALLTEAFGPQVFETYGCREVMLIGSECAAHDGLHLSMENLIVEVVVREGERLRPALPGEVGEVLLTDLHNYGMPFLRYANGDLAVVAPARRCSCGRTLPRLASVEGRTASMMRDAQGQPVCGILFSRIFSWSDALARAVARWQVVQHADSTVTVRLQPAHAPDPHALEDLRRAVARYLPGVVVRTEWTRLIPPGANGKHRTVVVEAPKAAA